MDTEKANQQSQQSHPPVDVVEVDPEKIQDEFLNTGRIGRRNALPDILDSHCETSTADLPLKLSALTTSDSSSSSNCPNQKNSSSNNK
ncbi:hypothetical protein ACKWTF_009578 [Chironomus riparius]